MLISYQFAPCMPNIPSLEPSGDYDHELCMLEDCIFPIDFVLAKFAIPKVSCTT